jgi:hypothetical protein
MRPILVMGDRLAVEGPAVDHNALPVAPVSKLGCTDFQTIETLGDSERHDGSYWKKSN